MLAILLYITHKLIFYYGKEKRNCKECKRIEYFSS